MTKSPIEFIDYMQQILKLFSPGILTTNENLNHASHQTFEGGSSEEDSDGRQSVADANREHDEKIETFYRELVENTNKYHNQLETFVKE